IPNTFRDTSAAAIAASGLLQLSQLETNPAASLRYWAGGKAILSSLLSPSYLAQGSASHGVLLHGAWFVPAPENNGDASLVWGDYYLLEAMNEYVGTLGAVPGTTIASPSSNAYTRFSPNTSPAYSGPVVTVGSASAATNTTVQIPIQVTDANGAADEDIEGMSFAIQISGGTGAA